MLTFIINIYKKYFPYKLRSFIYGLRTLIKKKSTFFIVNENGFCDDGLATNHVCDFMHDEEFMRSYNEGTKKNELETHPTEVYYRAYILTYFAQHCINLESDFVELIKGNLPESIKKVSLKKISFLHIDLNNAHSEI